MKWNGEDHVPQCKCYNKTLISCFYAKVLLTKAMLPTTITNGSVISP